MSCQECSSHSNKDESKEILFNPNVFTEFKLAGNKEVLYITLWIIRLSIFQDYFSLNLLVTYSPGNRCG